MRQCRIFAKKWRLFKWLLPASLLSIFLSGCVTLFNPEASQEFTSHQIGVVNAENTIGQSITSLRHQVNGITLWLSRSNPEKDTNHDNLIITIFSDPSSNQPITTTTISTASVSQYTPVQIAIPPFTIPDDDSFFIELSTVDNDLLVHGRMEDSYPGGQVYHNREPVNSDLAFRVTYLYNTDDLWQDIIGIITQSKFIIIALVVLILPGYAIIRLFHLNKFFTFPELLALAVGCSLSLIPIIYLYVSSLSIALQPPQIIILGGLFIIAIIIMSVIDRSYLPILNFIKRPKIFIRKPETKKNFLNYIHLPALIGILTIGFIVRVVMIRDLATPAWVDAYHHGLITRLILENGTLPSSYTPYLDIESTLYHPGFHSSLVVFLKLSGMDITQGMLLFGQILNALAGLAVYLLTTTITRRPNAGLVAALITTAFSAMPAYYTSWGRYPQLTGLLILPVAFALIISIKERDNKRQIINLVLCSSLALTGLFLVHYRVAVFLVCLLLAWLLAEFIFNLPKLLIFIQKILVPLVILGILTFILASPWLLPALRDTILPRIAPNQTEASLNFFSDFSWHYLTPVYGKQVIIFTALGSLWALINKNKIFITITGWILLLFFIANLDAFNLPGGSFINNSSVAIMLFMPFSVVSGYLIDQVACLWRNFLHGPLQHFVPILISCLAFYMLFTGSKQLTEILNPTTLLTRQADLTAIQWIDHNLSDDKTILINPFPWGYGLFAGSDGGAWIPALAGNQTIPPPVIYGLGSEAQKTYTNQVCQEVTRLGTNPDELWNYLSSLRIEYIFIGERGGVISPQGIASNMHYEIVYHQNNTWLFHLLPVKPK